MKNKFLKYISIQFLILIFIMPIFAGDTIRFAPLPMENASTTLKIFAPFITFLEKKSGKKVEVIYRAKNSEIMDGLKNNEIDIAHFGALPYVKLSKEFNSIVPIVQFMEKNGSDIYTCTMFKRKDQSIDLKNIKNKKFALPQKYSTCGYAFAQNILKKHNNTLDKNRFNYLGSHYDTIFEVTTGDFDIGTAKTSIFNKFSHLDLESIEISQPNPCLMIVANKSTLTQSEIKHIKDIILSSTKEDRKNWDSKINRIATEPNVKLLNQYKNRIKDIRLKNEN